MPSYERFAVRAIPSKDTVISRTHDFICEATEPRCTNKHICRFKCLKATNFRNLTCQVLQNSKYLSVLILQTFIISSLIKTICNHQPLAHRYPPTSG